MKITIEMDDVLDDCVNRAIEQTHLELDSFLEENNPDGCPDFNELDYHGSIHEIVDSAVPIYTKQIKDAWYLHSDDLIAAYENARVGDNPMENNGMAAIYFYIHEKVYEWFSENAETIFEEFVNSKPATA